MFLVCNLNGPHSSSVDFQPRSNRRVSCVRLINPSDSLIMTVVCVCLSVYRHAAACVSMAMAVLHPGPPRGDGEGAEETESGPDGSSGR